jgi:hypothetical protein
VETGREQLTVYCAKDFIDAVAEDKTSVLDRHHCCGSREDLPVYIDDVLFQLVLVPVAVYSQAVVPNTGVRRPGAGSVSVPEKVPAAVSVPRSSIPDEVVPVANSVRIVIPLLKLTVPESARTVDGGGACHALVEVAMPPAVNSRCSKIT